MSRYAEVGNNHVVVRSAYKHTVAIVEEPTAKQKKAHTNKMQRDLEKKYQLIRQLTDLHLLDAIWSDNFVEIRKTINGVNFELYKAWLAEQRQKEKEKEAQ